MRRGTLGFSFVSLESLESRRLLSTAVGAIDHDLLPPAPLAAASVVAGVETSVTLATETPTFRADRVGIFVAQVTTDFPHRTTVIAGNVELRSADGTVVAAAHPDADGMATLIVFGLAPGTHELTAHYVPHASDADSQPQPGTSNLMTVVVTPGEITLATTARGKVVSYTNSNRYPARLTVFLGEPGKPTPTGRVAFYNTATYQPSFMGWADLDATGRAVMDNFSPDGPYGYATWRVVYAGDAHYTAAGYSLGAGITYATQEVESWTGLTGMPAESGSGLTLTAKVNVALKEYISGWGRSPEGVVAFMDGSTLLGTAHLNADGVATLELSEWPADPSRLRAVYGGDTQFSGSQSPQLIQDTQTTMRVESFINVDGATVIRVDFEGDGSFRGMVTFERGGKWLGRALVMDNSATFTLNRRYDLKEDIRVSFTGDPAHDPAEATISIGGDRRLSWFSGIGQVWVYEGQTWRLSGRINGGVDAPASGSIVVRGSNGVLGSATLDELGMFELELPGLPVGLSKLTIEYSGDAQLIAATQALNVEGLARQVTALPPAATLVTSRPDGLYGEQRQVWIDVSRQQLVLRYVDAAGLPLRTRDLTEDVDPRWQIVATGDLDGDGKAEVIWQNAVTRRALSWSFGDSALGTQLIHAGAPAEGWRIVGAGDFNCDGTADLVWRNDQTGQASVWFMRSSFVQGFGMFNHAPRNLAWTIESVEDVDGDGSPDLLWRNQSTGGAFTWLMRRTSIIGTQV